MTNEMIIFKIPYLKFIIKFKEKETITQFDMTEQFPMDLRQIPDEDSAKMYGEVLLQSLVVNDVLKKEVGKDFLSKCQHNIESDTSSPQLKYHTLCIFRFLDLKNKSSLKLFSMLTGHPIFITFLDLARKHDPKKAVSQKGKNLFPTNPELGKKFMRLLLESIKFWSERFPSNSSQKPTKYKLGYLDLVQKSGVTFPTSYIMYGANGGSTEEKTEKPTPAGDTTKYGKSASNTQKENAKVQPSTPITPTGNQANTPEEKVTKSSIMLLFNKIQTFIGFLEDSDSVDQLEREINKNHKTFEKEQKRLENSNVFSIEDEKIINLYLKINEFFLNEKSIFDEWMTQKDSLKTYVQSLFIKYDEIFAQELAEDNKPQEKPSKQKVQAPAEQSRSTVKNEQKSKNAYNSTVSNKENSKQDKKKYESMNSEKQKESRKARQEDQEQKPKLKQKKTNVQTDEIKDRALKNFFDSHLEKPSKKSLSGFKAIKESIEKEKKDLKPRARGKSPINSMSKTKFNASTVSKIDTNSIFAKPPNPNVRPKRYEGTVVSPLYEFENILLDIQKEQGMKRFKISNLKSRALLYESGHIQVGYKSEPVYEKVEELDKFSEMIQLEIFIGNKTGQELRQVDVTFLGDQKSLVYSNPQKAPEIIGSGDQCLFTVIIIPCAQSYSMTTMQISYKYHSSQMRSICVLPSTILKFASYQKADVRDMNDYERSEAIKCYQSQRFSLSHYFPPKKLQHYIEELNQVTSYSEFAQNGSEKDYILGAFCLIKNKYDGLVKINVRPDLSVVVQLMSNNQTEEAQQEFKLYIQTLSMVLKEHR